VGSQARRERAIPENVPRRARPTRADVREISARATLGNMPSDDVMDEDDN
jgi:hypothetical protein